MLVPHHLLVIPKRHVEYPSALEPEEYLELMYTVVELQTTILMLKPGMGCDVRQNCRPFLPQSDYKIDHLHWHILPRLFEDQLYLRVQKFEKGLFDEHFLSPKQMQEEMKALKRLLFLP